MTRVILDGTIKGLRGKIGNLIFRQMPDGTTVVSQAQPKKNSREKKRAKLKRSPRQQAHNDRFGESSAYAKRFQIHTVYVELAEVTPMNTAYNLALKDWFEPPKIHQIKRQKKRILVQASDNIMVSKVSVTIFNEAGEILEMGDAVRQKGDWWAFPSHTKGKTVKAEAWDLPGHVTRLVV